MRNLFKLSFAALALMLVGCNAENEDLNPDSPDKEPTTKFTATLEQNDALTKVYLVGEELRWDAEENLAVFEDYPAQPTRFALDGMSIGSSVGEFYRDEVIEKNEPGDLKGWNVAVNPYSQFTDAGKMVCRYTENGSADDMTFTVQSINVAAEQLWYQDGGLGFTFPMMAISRNTDLAFRNMCGLLRVQLWGSADIKVAKVTLEGNNNEIIAGAFDAQMNTKTYVPSLLPKDQGGVSEINLTCTQPVQLIDDPGQPYWFTFSLAPTVFENGFTVTVTTVDGGTATFTTDKRIEVPRSVLVNMDPKQVVAVPTIPELTAQSVNYTLEMPEGKKIMALNMSGADNSFSGTFRFEVDPSEKVLPAGVYTLGNGVGTFQGQYVSIKTDPAGYAMDPVNIHEGSQFTVELNSENYTIIGYLKVGFQDPANPELETSQAEYIVSYTGKIENMFQPDFSQATITGASLKSGCYWNDSAICTFNYSNENTLEAYWAFPATNAPEGQYFIPAGTYVVKNVPWGENDDFTLNPFSTKLTVNGQSQNTLEGGTITVSYDGNNYMVAMDLTTTYGIQLNQTYTGPIQDLVVPALPAVPVELTADKADYTLEFNEQRRNIFVLGLSANDNSFSGSMRIIGRWDDKNLQAGTYTYGNPDMNGAEQVFKLVNFAEGENAGTITGGTLDVALTGEVYTLTADVVMSLNGEEIEYIIHYNGEIANMFQPDFSAETITGANLVAGSYTGDAAKLNLNYSNGAALQLALNFAQTNAEAGSYYLPKGTYALTAGPDASLTIDSAQSSLALNGASQNFVGDGSVTVKYNGTDYEIVVNLTTNYGIVLSQTYTGQIQDLVVPAGLVNNLTADTISYSQESTPTGQPAFVLGLSTNDYSFNGSMRVIGTAGDKTLKPGIYAYGSEGNNVFEMLSFSADKSGKVESGTLNVELAGQVYTLTAEVVLAVTMWNQDTWEEVPTGEKVNYTVHYTGEIENMFQPDLSALTITSAELVYEYGYYGYYGNEARVKLLMSDGDYYIDLYVGFPDTGLYGVDNKGKWYIPAGTYPMGMFGTYYTQPMSTVLKKVSDPNFKQSMLNSADKDVKVSIQGNNYVIQLNLSTSYGIVLNQTYTGPIKDLVLPPLQ